MHETRGRAVLMRGARNFVPRLPLADERGA
jgi:hypothetical protein